MMEPFVSIIVPVYKVPEQYLRKCIESTMTQTLKKIENDKYFKVDESEFMAFTPQTTGFALLIPKEEIGVDNTNE